MYESNGYLNISNSPGERLVVAVDEQLIEYYRWFCLRRGVKLNRQKYKPHISVVRNELISNTEVWNSYLKINNSFEIKFKYNSATFNDDIYHWLAVESKQLEDLRCSFGLPPIKENVTMSPDGQHRFHITIGNLKYAV